MKQNKKYPWVVIDVIVNIRKQIRAQVKNARDKGICITTNEPLKKGKFLTIEISLPGMETLKLNGRVMWSMKIDSQFFENGIDFTVMNHYLQRIAAGLLN